MEKARIIKKGKYQYIELSAKFKISKNHFFVEHELGMLIVDSEKRIKRLEKLMGKASDDFFPNGYKDDSVWPKREPFD